MKLHVHVASGKDREEGLALSLQSGLTPFGDVVAASPTANFSGIDPEADIGAVFGLKGRSREIMDAYRAAGKHSIMFDKALIRVPGGAPKNLRVCIDADSPIKYLMREMRSFERWERLRIDILPERQEWHRGPIILALSSQKYCDYHGLGDATEYAKRLVAQIHEHHRKRPIIYRPKPSWHDFVPIPGTRLSRPPEYLPALLSDAHVVVTHGSSAAIDAILAGVPAITLGECAAWPVANHSVEDCPHPWLPSREARWQFGVQLAHCEWSPEELQSGEAWSFIRNEILALEK